MLFEKALKTVSKSNPGSDNDFVDKLNFRYTSGLYLLFAVAVISRYYISSSISCWTPAQFADSWTDYTNNLCFIENTYHLPMDVSIESGRDMGMAYHITYYQWIPLFFMWLAMCFYIPRAIWYNVFSHHFVDINAIVDLLTSFDNAVNPETRDPAVGQVARHIDRYLCNCTEYRNAPFFQARTTIAKSRTFVFYIGRRYGLNVTLVYLMMKVCYIFTAFFQLFWIDAFLQNSTTTLTFSAYFSNIFTTSYVINVFYNLYRGTTWSDSPAFPRVTLCDFEVRNLGQVHKHTIQCVLPINLFNEKIFLFLWIWVLMVLTLTFINLLMWLWRIGFYCNRKKYIMKHLKLMGKFDEDGCGSKYSLRVTKRLINRFIHDYLRPDGVFLLRLLAINTNCLIASEIIGELWEAFLENPKTARKAEQYNLKYRKKFPSEHLERALGDHPENEYSLNRAAAAPLVIKRRNNKAFSIFQPSMTEDQPQTNVQALHELRKFQEKYYGGSMQSVTNKGVDFREPPLREVMGRKNGKCANLMQCVESPQSPTEGCIDPPWKKTRPQQTFLRRLKKLIVYEDSDSESDYFEEEIEEMPESPLKTTERNKKFFTCLKMEGSDEEEANPQKPAEKSEQAEQGQQSYTQDPTLPSYTQSISVPPSALRSPPRNHSFVPTVTGNN